MTEGNVAANGSLSHMVRRIEEYLTAVK